MEKKQQECYVCENTDFGEVRVVMNEADEPMFCLADVCKALELSNPRQVKTRLNDKGLQMVNLNTVTNNDGIISAGNLSFSRGRRRPKRSKSG